MTGAVTTHAVRLTRVVRVAPERVFRALTEESELLRWFCPEPGKVKEVELDLEVGGRFRVVMGMPDADHAASGVYREIEPPRRVSLTWTWDEEEDASETILTFELTPHDDGTEVTLTHERLATPESRDMHEQGWSSCLDRLEALLA